MKCATYIFLWTALAGLAGATEFAQKTAVVHPNVLFIAVDDLRPQLGCYGNEMIKSPNIDALATQGIVFKQAYCQQAVCMASRASLLSGYRPDYAEIYSCKSVTELLPDVVTLNKYFGDSGYNVWGGGKIYHFGEDNTGQFGSTYYNPKGDWKGRGYLAENSFRIMDEYVIECREIYGKDSKGKGPAYESPDVPDSAYHDGMVADAAIRELETLSSSDRPFFMAVGFRKPHLPFNAPKKYWDLYSTTDLQLATNPFLPANATEFTDTSSGELRSYSGIPKGDAPLTDKKMSQNLIHGYYACISYVDAQIGRILNELDRLGVRDNTIIVLWGDHGWKLGDHGRWCKHTHFEVDGRVPLIISYPGMQHRGESVVSLAELVDLYPTLCELSGLPKPEHLQGDSLVHAMESPSLELNKTAFSQWPKGNAASKNVVIGYTIRNEVYRYTEWTKKRTGEVLARELYDLSTDPNENINVGGLPEKKELVARLSALLDGGRGWNAYRLK